MAEEEYDLKVVELQSDINNLRQMLEVRRGCRAPVRHQQHQADAGGKERLASSSQTSTTSGRCWRKGEVAELQSDINNLRQMLGVRRG